MDAIMLFRDQDVSFISKKVDEALKLKGFWEVVDGPAAIAVLKITNPIVSPKLPDNLKTDIHSMMDEIIEGDKAGASEKLADLLNSRIDVPFFDEGSEGFIFKGAITWIVGLLKL